MSSSWAGTGGGGVMGTMMPMRGSLADGCASVWTGAATRARTTAMERALPITDRPSSCPAGLATRPRHRLDAWGVGAFGHGGGDRVVLDAVDHAEADVVARAQQDGVGRRVIVEGEWRATEHPEAARALDRVDAALDAADADAAGRGLGARLDESRDVKALGHARHVGQPRCEAHEVDI